MLRIIVTGASGRMGKTLCRAILQHPDCILAGATERIDSPFVGQAIGSIRYTTDLAALLPHADVVVDFTAPDASVAHAHAVAAAGKAIVVGTTGLGDAHHTALREAAQRIPLVYSPNTSVGVNLFWHIAERMAAICHAQYQLSIDETHHVHKIDAPSGTAKELQRVALAASGLAPDAIPVQSHRHGEVIGEHTLAARMAGETITLTHTAQTRDIFADGALTAARWLAGKPAGFYSMKDVLGLG